MEYVEGATLKAHITKGPLQPSELVRLAIQIAQALDVAHSVGIIATGKQADLSVWNVEGLAELGYWVGLPGPERRIYAGNDA